MDPCLQKGRKGKDLFQGICQICLPTGFVSGGSIDQPYSVPAAQGQLSTCLWGRTRGRSRDEWTFVVVNSHAKSIWEAHSLLCERFLWELYRKKHHFFLLLLSASTLENGLCPFNALHCIPQSNLGALYLVRTIRLLHLCARRGLVAFVCYTVYSTSCPYQPHPTLSSVSQLWVEPGWREMVGMCCSKGDKDEEKTQKRRKDQRKRKM